MTNMVFCSNLASGGIIAYNGDSARGWNDPPTFAFSNNSTGNRPKLDLRKRVSHQQALHGIQTPSQSLQPAVVNNEEITNGTSRFSSVSELKSCWDCLILRIAQFSDVMMTKTLKIIYKLCTLPWCYMSVIHLSRKILVQ